MPNWCQNCLILTGDNEQLAAFAELVDNKGFSFGLFAPKPAHYDADVWRHLAWGTSWEAMNIEIKTSSERVVLHFETGWAPPVRVLDYILAMFPKLQAELGFAEGGMEFYGSVIVYSPDEAAYKSKLFWDGEKAAPMRVDEEIGIRWIHPGSDGEYIEYFSSTFVAHMERYNILPGG